MEAPRPSEIDALKRQLSTTVRRAVELEAQFATARERHAAYPNDAVSAHRIDSLPLEIAAVRATIATIREELSPMTGGPTAV
jgi:hypothetical protein